MDVAASEFYGKDKNYDLNFKEEVGFLLRSALKTKNLSKYMKFQGGEMYSSNFRNWIAPTPSLA